jgi:hypothetical protein
VNSEVNEIVVFGGSKSSAEYASDEAARGYKAVPLDRSGGCSRRINNCRVPGTTVRI